MLEFAPKLLYWLSSILSYAGGTALPILVKSDFCKLQLESLRQLMRDNGRFYVTEKLITVIFWMSRVSRGLAVRITERYKIEKGLRAVQTRNQNGAVDF